MSDISLKCHQRGARKLYDELLDLSRPNAPLQGLELDSGYQKLDYHDANNPGRNPKGTTVGKGNAQIQCEELWENGLNALDKLGEMAGWEEDPAQAKTANQKQAIESYQKLRRLIEGVVRRPIPWVLEAPHYGVTSKERIEKLKAAKKIRYKITEAIKKLNALLGKEKLDPLQHQKCLIACLFWFVLVPEDGQGEPLDDQGHPLLVAFLARQGIDERTANKIKEQFSKYLQQSGGGLGLIRAGQSGDKKDDAKTEATALETILNKKGWCTEQSKVMYAVLRMAGVEAFFVEPSLSVEYKIAKANPWEKETLKRLTDKPLLSHVASGVAVKILDKNGKESVWIIDVTARLLEADYIHENQDQWKAHPYWELSLRHFYMVDLANLGFDQMGQGGFSRAERSLRMALNLGGDSTSFHAAGNLAYLLSRKLERLSCRSKDVRKACKDLEEAVDQLSKTAAENPYSPVFLFNRGKFLLYRHNVAEAVEAFFQAIDADPRYILPYQKLKKVINDILEYEPKEFADVRQVFIEQTPKVVGRHPRLKEIIKNGLEKMKPKKRKPREKLSLKDKKVIELIDELIKASKL